MAGGTSCKKDAKAFAAVTKAIAKHGAALAALPGVAEVWPGYKFQGCQLTDEPAIVVSVLAKLAKGRVKKDALLPAVLDGIGVDVVPASPAQLVRFAMEHGEALTPVSAPKLMGMVAAPRKLEFIMNDGNKENEAAMAELRGAFKKRMEFAWAAVADGRHVTKAFFPRAYHIKVAVRDGAAYWLSSGNWKDSNQPERDPIVEPFPMKAKRDAYYRKQNRNWHVLVENGALAEQFERFIQFDA